MSENLKLPICPKCNDTKNVYKSFWQKTDMSFTEYNCSVCKIKWCSTPSGYGVISKHDKYDLCGLKN